MEFPGYGADFVEQPSQQYECPVCLLVLREPYLLSCCGIKVCHPCVTTIQNTTPAVCPMCRETFTAMMDKQLNRLILDLAVRCPLKRNGCNWVGELRHLNEHTASVINGCQFVEVSCRNSCGGVYPRHALQQHVTENCANRPIDEHVQQIIRKEILEEVRLEYDRRISQLEEMNISHDQRITQLENEVTELNKQLIEKTEVISNLGASSKGFLECRSNSMSDILVKDHHQPSGCRDVTRGRSSSYDPKLSRPKKLSSVDEVDYNDEFIFSPDVNDGRVIANCQACKNIPTDPVMMNCCVMTYCNGCLRGLFGSSSYCPTCKSLLRSIKGNQPLGTMKTDTSRQSLPGSPRCGTIIISYSFPGGKQGPEHPNPGQNFSGTVCNAYLPNNEEGRRVLKLLKTAFDAGIIFTIGTSASGKKNTVAWNNIHHKTNTNGGRANYGYPDDAYLKRIQVELKANGIY